ncbi:alpha/beta hydrolase [Changchengzhania lutea]|uniref:alpha/beta hydrolase n=1 Tax=Changchengzhania lutea TaxID=2049305 RepID=UPI00115DDF99|nr:alpha/beta hydrolase [Changchengzhania lutea]
MQTIKNAFLYFCLFMLCFNCSNDTKSNEEVTIETESLNFYQELDVSYGSQIDQKFNLYLPANRSTDTKIMILIHGGGWTSGDKSEMNAIKDVILQDLPEIAIVNMNYRLATSFSDAYPKQLDDITEVVNYLKTNASNYFISNDIGFVGVSAGAHLALLWSYAFDTNSQTKMVCSIVGPTNFTDPAYLENANPILQLLLGTDNATTDYLEEVSPYHQVKVLSPPTILFNGGKDPLIPITQGTDLRDKLNVLGIKNEFTLYENEGHGWDGESLLDTWAKLKVFTKTHLY